MKLSFSSSTHGPLVFKPVVPAGLEGIMFPSAVPGSAEGAYGTVLRQELDADPFSALHCLYRLRETFSLQTRGTGPVLRVHIILKKDRTYDINGLGDVSLKEGQYNIMYAPFTQESVVFESGPDYCCFTAYYPVEHIRQLLRYFPLLTVFEQQVNDAQPAILLRWHGWVNIDISKIVNGLLESTLTGPLQHAYFDGKLQELMIALLWQRHNPRNEASGLSGQDINSVGQARYIIEMHTGKPLTVKAIATKINITEFKLKSIFRGLTGANISAFMLDTRLSKARSLLRDTDVPMKEIADQAGYNSLQSFITAFHKHFDCTPAAYRRQEKLPYVA